MIISFFAGKWGVLMLAAALQRLTTLVSLDVSNCGLTTELLHV
jgi:hypothetical protein